jgi:hypothetical protein
VIAETAKTVNRIPNVPQLQMEARGQPTTEMSNAGHAIGAISTVLGVFSVGPSSKVCVGELHLPLLTNDVDDEVLIDSQPLFIE